jgi:hypothetical protein
MYFTAAVVGAGVKHFGDRSLVSVTGFRFHNGEA